MTVTEGAQQSQAVRRATRAGAPGRGGGRLGPIRVGQLVALELVALMVILSLARPMWLQVPVVVAAVALLGLAFGRRNGRWWYEHLALKRRFRLRRRQVAEVARRVDTRRIVLAGLAPDLSVTEVVDRGTTFGVGQDSDGWFVVFQVGAGTGLQEQRGALIGLDRLAGMLSEMSVPISSLQLVSHTVPAPARYLDPRVPAVQSYQELLAGAMIPASHHVWLAVRLDVADGVRAAASRGGGIDGVQRALAASVGRITKSLQSSIGGRPLTANELVAALATVAGMPMGAGGRAGLAGAASQAVEEWTGWRDSTATHVCFQLEGLPRQPLGELIGELIRSSALSFTLSVLAEQGHPLSLRPLLRISSRPEAIDGAARAVSELLQRSGTPARRLDGQHALALYATAPTGGGSYDGGR